MKRFWNPCAAWEPLIGLRASRLLPAEEAAALDKHLANCPRCRVHSQQLAEVARGLRALLEFEQPLPQTVRARWLESVRANAGVKRRKEATRQPGFPWLKWLAGQWRPAAVCGPIWIAILLFRLNTAPVPDEHQGIHSVVPAPAMLQTLRQQQEFLADLARSLQTDTSADHAAPPALRPRTQKTGRARPV